MGVALGIGELFHQGTLHTSALAELLLLWADPVGRARWALLGMLPPWLAPHAPAF